MESSIGSKKNQSSSGEEQDINLSTLPTRAGLNLYDYHLIKYKGYWYPDMFILERILSAQRHFKAQPSDIFLCSAPKTGTLWLKSLAYAIVSRTSLNDDNPLLTKVAHEILPNLEITKSNTPFNPDPKNPLIPTHIPFVSLPKSVSDSSGCKIVYICRDPKATFVSMYHFFSKLATSRNMEPVPLDKAFEHFCNGESFFGPYWDHVLGYWKASLDHPDKVLFLKYEEMKDDTAFYATKLAEFIGYGFTLEEERNGVVEKIVRMCSFENLSNLEVNKNGKFGKNTHLEMDNNVFFRKGSVKDWENYLTPEMALHMDSITKNKLSGSGLNLIYHKK